MSMAKHIFGGFITLKGLPRLNVNCSRNLTFCNIKDIYLTKNSYGNEAKVKGWVKALRKMKDNIFIDLDDGSCSTRLQVVIAKHSAPLELTYGASVEIRGKLVQNELKHVELVSQDLKVLGPCIVSDGFPFAPRKTYPDDYVRQFIHLRPRTKTFSSLLRIRHCTARALNDYFDRSNFLKIDVPILTSNDCEGAGEVFSIRPDNEALISEMASSEHKGADEVFFNGKTFLTVSGQMHLEAAARALGNVYCCGPTFRAENSKSRLHLSEFYMAEAELAFTKSLDDVLSVMEALVKSIAQRLLDDCAEDLITFVKGSNSLNSEHLLRSRFAVASYDEVCETLARHDHPVPKGQALTKEHELFLVKHNDNVPMFVVEWPSSIKPFYMKPLESDTSKVSAVDLLCSNVGELCGGSLREDDYSALSEKLQENKLQDKLAWYLELRKFGNIPTGGFGMGFERLLQVILGIPNIKDTIPFPRYPHSCKL